MIEMLAEKFWSYCACWNATSLTTGASVLLLSSCIAVPIPHERQLTPLYYGTVTDASTGAPIESVTISVSPISRVGRSSTAETKTDAFGRYEIAVTENATWFVLIAGPAEGSCGGVLLFAHPGYELVQRETSEFRSGGVDGVCRGSKKQVDVSLKKK